MIIFSLATYFYYAVMLFSSKLSEVLLIPQLAQAAQRPPPHLSHLEAKISANSGEIDSSTTTSIPSFLRSSTNFSNSKAMIVFNRK